jgi:hypothetical protein
MVRLIVITRAQRQELERLLFDEMDKCEDELKACHYENWDGSTDRLREAEYRNLEEKVDLLRSIAPKLVDTIGGS